MAAGMHAPGTGAGRATAPAGPRSFGSKMAGATAAAAPHVTRDAYGRFVDTLALR